jgi:RNA polymerase sigma-70 factor, ECF subfamily
MNSASQTDEQLLRGVVSSDMQAFRTLFDKYQPILFRHLFFRLRDADVSHDIIQEIFLRVWERRTSLKPELPFLAYLLRIGGNLIIDHVRHVQVRLRHNERLAAEHPSSGDDPEEAYRQKVLEEEIRRIVNNDLSDRRRSIYLLSRTEGMSNGEIAQMLHISIKTVENQLTSALKVLRKKLAPFL